MNLQREISCFTRFLVLKDSQKQKQNISIATNAGPSFLQCYMSFTFSKLRLDFISCQLGSMLPNLPRSLFDCNYVVEVHMKNASKNLNRDIFLMSCRFAWSNTLMTKTVFRYFLEGNPFECASVFEFPVGSRCHLPIVGLC